MTTIMFIVPELLTGVLFVGIIWGLNNTKPGGH